MSSPETRHRRIPRIAAGTALLLAASFAATGTATADTVPPDVADEPEVRNGPPGDNGTVKVHDPDTPDDDNRNEPHVCEFTLVGSNFDSEQEIWWTTRAWPPTDETGERPVVLEGTLTLDEDGHGSTDTYTLDDGHYKLFWNFEDQEGRAKQKVFWVECEDEDELGEEDDSDEEQPPAEEDEQEPPAEEDEEPAPETEDPDGGDDGDGDDGDEQPAPENADSEDGGLPVTGAALAGLIATGALTLGGGATALFLSRKRRSAAGDSAAGGTEESASTED